MNFEKRYKSISKEYLQIESLKQNSNNGNFDIMRFNKSGGFVSRIRERREAGCSQDATYQIQHSSATDDIAFMFIKVNYWGNINKEAESAIEENLKDWVRFGRKIGIRAEYKGIHTLNDFYKARGITPVNYGDNSRSFFIIEWNTSELLSPKHGLAILSFFRYFYSPFNGSIYKSSIELINKYPSLTEMESFYLAHMIGSASSYDPYYGFYIVPRNSNESRADTDNGDGDDEEENDATNMVPIPGIPNIRKIWTNYTSNKALNMVWTVNVQATIKKITKKEYEEIFKGKVSDYLWGKLVEQGMDGISVIPMIGKNAPASEFQSELKKADKAGNLDEVIKGLTFLYNV